MTKVKLAKLVFSEKAMGELFNAKHDAKVAYKLAVFGINIRKEFDALNDVKNKKIKELGSPVKEGSDVFRVDPDNMDEFNKFYAELLDNEVEITLPGINMSDLKGEFSPNDLAMLDWVFDDTRVAEEQKSSKKKK